MQTHAVTGVQTETARRCGVSVGTVRRILQEAIENNDPELRSKHAEAAGVLAGKIHVQAEKILDSISEEDLESGRIPIEDKNGKITGYKSYGPNLLQKATAFGITVDKANVAQQFQHAMIEDQKSGELMLPEGVEALTDAIRGQLKSLKILDIQFEDKHPDITKTTEAAVSEAEVLNRVAEEKPEVVSLDEFDNPE